MEKSDAIWGAAAIGEYLGLNKKQTFHLLENGRLPAKKVGARWLCSKAKLQAFIEKEAA